MSNIGGRRADAAPTELRLPLALAIYKDVGPMGLIAAPLGA